LKGESHFGVFASEDIKANSELFYDYNFSTFNGSVESQQICYCGSQLCRGTIGKKARK
jgi:SET domain-containing protein